MKTIALRYAETFAPDIGTIAAHESIIKSAGFVWYGKMGTPLSAKVTNIVLGNEKPRILLIQSGGINRHWAYIAGIQREQPDLTYVPDYYHDRISNVKTWFKVLYFEPAAKDVLSKCIVSSSGNPLTAVSRASMSPYYIVDFEGN